MADLDALVTAARDATIRRDVAETYVRELDRWAARPPERRWWPLWLGGAAMAAAVVAVVVMRPRELEPIALRIGDRVAIVAEPGTAYRVVTATADATTIEVAHGAVTARLWPGARLHHLVLAGGGVTASAKGTIYQLSVERGHASVDVAEGTVEVAEAGELHRVPAGTAWPAAATHHLRAADVLRAMPAPEVVVVPVDAPPPEVARDAPPPAPPAPRPVAAPRAAPLPAAPSIKDRWRDARLLRAQGKFAEAVAACLAIADAGDATWSPIALVEAVRIQVGPLAAPEQALALADRMLRDWPRDALKREAAALRCQALGQLGRASECATR